MKSLYSTNSLSTSFKPLYYSRNLALPQAIHYNCTITYKTKKSIVCSKASAGAARESPKDKFGGTTFTGPAMKPCHGIGVVNFLRGKNYLITGATGFVAKAMIEKMLKTVPEVGKIFLLIKAKNNEAAVQRLNTEIIDCELFKSLQEVHGKSYKAFMLSKLVPVAGNVCESNLGMDAEIANEIAKEVDVIINSAANTTFDERYDVALNMNTKGPSRLLYFAKTCKKISLFLYISTAYVNGERQGKIKEKPFQMGQSMTREMVNSGNHASVPVLDIDFELKLASDLAQSVTHKEATQRMKTLGIQRANIYGWPNTYSFSKAMGEMLINSMRGDLPVVIIRPTVIESSIRDPFPGWIQGNRMLDPILLSYGKGQLTGFPADPKVVLDVIPVDMVVNACIAAMAKHGRARTPELNVYHVGSSVINPLTVGDVIKYFFDYFKSSPLLDTRGNEINVSQMKLFSSMDNFSCYISSQIAKASGLSEVTMKKAEHFIQMAKLYEPYTFYKGRFDNSNTVKLMEEMCSEELMDFGFDVSTINWKQYMLSIHIPGLKKHVLKI